MKVTGIYPGTVKLLDDTGKFHYSINYSDGFRHWVVWDETPYEKQNEAKQVMREQIYLLRKKHGLLP